MTIRRFRPHVKLLAALLSIACFLSFEFAAAAPVFAAEASPPPLKWETWPRKPEPATGQPGAPPAAGPAAAGETAGAKTSEGISAGTWGWIAGGVAAVGLIALAFGGGGGGGSSAPAH